MTWYLTIYAPDWSPVSEQTCSEYIWANGIDHAQRIAHQRMLNETVVGRIEDVDVIPARASEALMSDMPTLADKIDAVTRLCRLGTVSGTITEIESLGDKGLLQRATLALAHPTQRGLKALVKRIKQIERAIPGHIKCRSGEVIEFDSMTTHEIDADRILRNNLGIFETVLIAGWDHDGDERFASSTGHNPDTFWLLQRFKEHLMHPPEDESEDFYDDDPDGEPAPVPADVLTFKRRT